MKISRQTKIASICLHLIKKIDEKLIDCQLSEIRNKSKHYTLRTKNSDWYINIIIINILHNIKCFKYHCAFSLYLT